MVEPRVEHVENLHRFSIEGVEDQVARESWDRSPAYAPALQGRIGWLVRPARLRVPGESCAEAFECFDEADGHIRVVIGDPVDVREELILRLSPSTDRDDHVPPFAGAFFFVPLRTRSRSVSKNSGVSSPRSSLLIAARSR